ncbi:MAG: CRISPR-associated endonuclease Cas2 [Saprospiraceae bacterium]|nr:CRISPR-associated endonuclease Cas2 [Saprospiraceae bacterium]
MILRMICYDIENDRFRNKLATKLLHFGFYRIQKSVFCGQHTPAQWERCKDIITKLFQRHGEEGDKIFVIILSKRMLEQMEVLGEEIDTDLILDKKLWLWIGEDD